MDLPKAVHVKFQSFLDSDYLLNKMQCSEPGIPDFMIPAYLSSFI